MKIVILSVWYSEKMGYIENCLSKSMAKLGHEVHVISSTVQVYYNEPNYKIIYEPYLGSNIQPVGEKKTDGFTLHRIPFKTLGGKIYLLGLKEKLKQIKPDAVQVFDCFSLTTLQAAYYKVLLNYKLFTANHTVASVFPPLQEKKDSTIYKTMFFITRTIPGKIIGMLTSRSYAPTIDALYITTDFYGVPKRKVQQVTLGVDTDFFKPLNTTPNEINERNNLRHSLGFNDNDIVCIYTGRFTNGKNPLCLAEAIDNLVKKGEPFKALFMGNGPQIEKIKSMQGCSVHKFVPYHELPKYYTIADIGVWPCQESTSMIDAAACGLPIIISNKVQATERVEGNGFTYIENNSDSLAEVILKMKNLEVRKQLGDFGMTKTLNNYSWDKLAQDRIKDYQIFIK